MPRMAARQLLPVLGLGLVGRQQLFCAAEVSDAVGLLQATVGVEDAPAPAAGYRTRAHERRAGREDEHLSAYNALQEGLKGVPGLGHSKHILSYVQGKDYSPSLRGGGCLYLPSNEAWKDFYAYVGHPYPPLFVEMVAGSFYPGCSPTALTGKQRSDSECPGGIMGAHRCVKFQPAGEAKIHAHSGGNSSTIQVFQTDGHVSLPRQWKSHIDRAPRSNHSRHRLSGGDPWNMPKDKCSKSWKLPAVPEGRKLVIPTQYVVCSPAPFHKGITRKMLKDQNMWMNTAYRGRSTWTKMDFDHDEDTEEVDMQIEFSLIKPGCKVNKFDDCHRIKFIVDKDCAQNAFVDANTVMKHNFDPVGTLTVFFVGDDQSGILGMADFPQLTLEGDKELVVRVSSMGLRHFSSENKELELDTSYDEGDTAVHETGHALGLYHTFEGGCTIDGDQVADTHPEAFPTYTCTQGRTCGNSDPVHNFMDYTPDACMSTFSQIQKRRLWCVFENYRPTLFKKSLQVSSDSSTAAPAESAGTATAGTATAAGSTGGTQTITIPVPAQAGAGAQGGGPGSVTVNIHMDR